MVWLLSEDAIREPTPHDAVQSLPPIRRREGDLSQHALARPIWKDPGNAHPSHQRSRGHDGIQVIPPLSRKDYTSHTRTYKLY